MIHIATCHLGSRWVDVQLDFLRRNMSAPYRTWVAAEDLDHEELAKFDVVLPAGGRHPAKLNLLAREVLAAASDDDLLMFLDSDAFPIADPIPRVLDELRANALVAIQRRENDGESHPHPAFCATTVGAWRELGGDWSDGDLWRKSSGHLTTDAGANLPRLLAEKGRTWAALTRTNTVDLHPVLFGVYGGIVYHHGAGSRHAFTRRDMADIPWRQRGPWPLRKGANAVVRVRRRRRAAANARLGAALYEDLRRDPDFWSRFVPAP